MRALLLPERGIYRRRFPIHLLEKGAYGRERERGGGLFCCHEERGVSYRLR